MTESDIGNLKVVLIDDDKMVLRSLESALQSMGYQITSFDNPMKGIEHIQNKGADIVISDICMPTCDGFQVLKKIKESDPQCDLIFITAHGQIDTAIRALREGASDFFEKPLSMSSLQAAMERTQKYRALAQQKKILSEQIYTLTGELLSRSNKVMLGRSSQMKKVASDIIDIAATNATVLVLGESGTGKELIAHAIHTASLRRNEPFITVNCPSIPEDLFESEMFGHRRGAFTGAIDSRVGYVETAKSGSIFLDEIGDMPFKMQPKILRLLEQRTFMSIGDSKEKSSEARIIAATNQPIEQLVAEKTFREDLYYRLSICTIKVPPLRERRDDIPILAMYYTLSFASDMSRAIDGIDDDVMKILIEYDYPGNIRELKNIIENTIIHIKHPGKIEPRDLPKMGLLKAANGLKDSSTPFNPTSLKFSDVEKQLYEEALNRSERNVSSASRLLGLSRSKLRRRLEALGIDA